MIEARAPRNLSALRRHPVRILSTSALALLLGGCAVLPAAGPASRSINAEKMADVGDGKIQIVNVTDDIARRLIASRQITHFSDVLGDGLPTGSIIGQGDALDISVWEAPPAALFGSLSAGGLPPASAAIVSPTGLARNTTLPEQSVGQEGTIRVPFAGTLNVVGRTPQQVAQDIQQRLRGKAHDPQVIVRIVRHSTTEVTVVGDVANSIRMPLTAKGERLLDALASAGGVKQPVNKMTIQVTRGTTVDSMPLESVISDPRQNIRLQSNDVVTLLFQPYSFTVLGAAGKNEEVNFEGTGLTLSQALGRMGGLQDTRANARGVFIFRLEDPKAFTEAGQTVATTKEGKVPVIYRVDMRDPTTLFVAQAFPIRDKDLIYVSNAPLAEFQKFLQAVSQIAYPIATLQNTGVF